MPVCAAVNGGFDFIFTVLDAFLGVYLAALMFAWPGTVVFFFSSLIKFLPEVLNVGILRVSPMFLQLKEVSVLS